MYVTIEERVLKHQIESGYYDDITPASAVGIAKQAVGKGYASLSEKQQMVIIKHLSQPCDGVTDPGGHHNRCQTILEGEELVDAYEQEGYRDALLCQSCTEESDGYASHWDRFSKD